MVRVRPALTDSEKTQCTVENSAQTIAVVRTPAHLTSHRHTDSHYMHTPLLQRMGGTRQKSFAFDHVFGMESSQQDVFEKAARGVADSALHGYNGK